MDKSLEVRTPSWKLKYAYIFAKESIIFANSMISGEIVDCQLLLTNVFAY